jgi:hypothetical protein
MVSHELKGCSGRSESCARESNSDKLVVVSHCCSVKFLIKVILGVGDKIEVIRHFSQRGKGEELTEKEKADLAALEKLIEALGDLLLAFMDRNERGIVWLTGPEIGLAKESCAWAAAERR